MINLAALTAGPQPTTLAPVKNLREAIFLPSGKVMMVDGDSYRARVRALETEGMTTSDAQGCADAEFIAASRSKHLMGKGLQDRIAAALADAPKPGPAEEEAGTIVAAAEVTIDAQTGEVPAVPASIVAVLEESATNLELAATLADVAQTEAPEPPPARQRKVAKAKVSPDLPKRKPGRPKKDDALTGAQRQALSQKKIKAAGGKRTTLNLSAGAVARIAELVKAGKFETERDAIEFAIMTVGMPV